ncbi:hypothetical protein BS78_08G063800, partial [Paspalum vaginatum]
MEFPDADGCPPWIDPGSGFRLVVNCGSYTASLDYGMLDISEQQHELWFDRCSQYDLDKFVDDMATLMIWGRCQTLVVWAVDVDSAAEWKIRTNEHFAKMIKSRLNENDGFLSAYSSVGPSVLTNIPPVDWSELTILPMPEMDGDAAAVADEERVFEAMGFKAADIDGEQARYVEIPIPVIPTEIENDMSDASIPVDDKDPEEPLLDWDRDHPD